MSTVSNSVNSVNNVNSVNSYSAVLPPSTMVFFRLHLPEITLDHVYTKASDREQGTGEPRDPLRNKSQVVIFVWSCRRELLLSSCSKRN